MKWREQKRDWKVRGATLKQPGIQGLKLILFINTPGTGLLF